MERHDSDLRATQAVGSWLIALVVILSPLPFLYFRLALGTWARVGMVLLQFAAGLAVQALVLGILALAVITLRRAIWRSEERALALLTQPLPHPRR